MVSSMPLWAGPRGAEHRCSCNQAQHASAKDIIDGVSNAKLHDQCWAEVAHYLIKLANSGVPLSPRTRRWGARPELHFHYQREMHSTELHFNGQGKSHLTNGEFNLNTGGVKAELRYQ